MHQELHPSFVKDAGMQECAPGGCLRRTLGLHKEECWRRLLGCAPGGDFGEVIGMCTRRGAWEGPWVCIKRDVWEGWWECAPGQVFGQDVGMCTKMGGLGCVELQQDHVLERSVLPLAGVGRGGVFDLHHRV